MPRSGDGVYSLPANTAAVTGQTIASAKYNTVNNDIANDLNAARPITAGGTGATNAVDALDNLGGVGQSNFLEAFKVGDGYFSVRDIGTEGGTWLLRNGALYDAADYPELAAILPPLPDSIVWSSVFSSANTTLRDFDQSGDTIVGVGEGSTSGSSIIITSNDGGLTWIQTYAAASEVLYGVRKTSSGWCAFGSRDSGGGNYNFLVATSSDGFSWTATQVSTTYRYRPSGGNRHTYNGTALILGVTRNSDSLPFVARSTDNGSSWTYASVPFSSIGGVVSSPSRTVVSNGTGDNVIISLDQGATFGSAVSANLGVDQIGGSAYDTVNSRMVFSQSSKLRYSTDGSTWTTVATSEAGVPFGISAGAIGTIARSNTRMQVSGNATTVSNYTSPGTSSLAVHAHKTDASVVFLGVSGGVVYRGVRTLPTQFAVPSDSPSYGWIKAENV